MGRPLWRHAWSIRSRLFDHQSSGSELLKFFEYPTGNPYNQLTSSGTPDDLKGRQMIAVDPRGQPVYIAPGNSTTINQRYWNNEIIADMPNVPAAAESPYGFKFDHTVPRVGRYISQSSTQIDDPFTVGELETVLREYDVDMRSLPQRLYRLLPSVQPGTQAFNTLKNAGMMQRNQITTDSSDLPSPNFQVPHNLRASLVQYYQSRGVMNVYQAFGITDLLNARLQGSSMAGNSTEIAKLVSPNLIAGLRMDINRPFGNGADDNNNGLVDEPGGISGNSPAAADSSPEQLNGTAIFPQFSGYRSTNVPMNLVNGSGPNGLDPVLSAKLPAGVATKRC